VQTEQTLNWIIESKVVAGMRGHFPPEVALELTRILIEYGISAFEFTLNSTQPIEAMQSVKREFGDAVCVGMGTVLDTESAKQVLDAGADFVVSPAFQPKVVEVVQQANVLIAPGVMTPSEAVQAHDMGVSLLKIFPIGSLGLDYFKAIMGPLNHLKFMCNGGMTAQNSVDFLKAGAVAVGMAGWLTGNGYTPEPILRQRAKEMQQAVQIVRGQTPQQSL
jgi:2-dehydro-3-deoxyphosphogluconate aldolase/(4S)-4-hydroxy-2-oxoglutarate aldolase